MSTRDNMRIMRTTDGKTFGQTVRRYRRGLEWSQERLAEQASLELSGPGLAQKAISMIESGTRPVRLDEADAIASALGIPLKQLLALDAMTPETKEQLAVQLGEANRAFEDLTGELTDRSRELDRLQTEIEFKRRQRDLLRGRMLMHRYRAAQIDAILNPDADNAYALQAALFSTGAGTSSVEGEDDGEHQEA